MRILVIGASRGIGRAVVDAALEAGHSVRALARHVERIEPRDRLETLAGDATDAAVLRQAIDGVDAVVMTLGIRESVAMLWQDVTLFSTATAALVPLMEKNGPRRLIAVTGIGAGDSRAALSGPERCGHRIIFSKPYRDKTRQEEIIRASRLDWTLVRPTILTNNRASGDYRVMVEPKDWRMGMISRADVADYVIRALQDPATIGTAPVLAR
ncbi:NAD(P)-dependent oxidoreductase [Thetidibacter halocola]|uniref:SDR family oxidoreductase n=1 Tax=Thetidibacter halocola TaxID=2827239 RepID=A0A8J8B925_9RHOB|nr:NAD(P)-binding oxidoreductase [Thetidibacter halocola]MBS0125115.1 SDR family oxidoreductase [Thetidibacter halocola]